MPWLGFYTPKVLSRKTSQRRPEAPGHLQMMVSSGGEDRETIGLTSLVYEGKYWLGIDLSSDLQACKLQSATIDWFHWRYAALVVSGRPRPLRRPMRLSVTSWMRSHDRTVANIVPRAASFGRQSTGNGVSVELSPPPG